MTDFLPNIFLVFLKELHLNLVTIFPWLTRYFTDGVTDTLQRLSVPPPVHFQLCMAVAVMYLSHSYAIF